MQNQKHKQKKTKSKIDKMAYLFVSPAVLSIFCVHIYPTIKGAAMGLTDQLFQYRSYSYVGIKNYLDIMADPLFWYSLENSVKLTFMVVAANIVLGMILALLLNYDYKFVKVFRLLLFIPWIFPSMVTTLMFRWLYNDIYGYANYILLKYHILEKPINILADPQLAWIGVWLPMVWASYPFVMVVFSAALKGIDRTIIEAAKIDGADGFQFFKNITFPVLKSSVMLVAILEVIWQFSSFDLIKLLTGGGPNNATLTLSIYIYQRAFEYKEFGYAGALGVIFFFILLIFTVMYFAVLRGNKNHE